MRVITASIFAIVWASVHAGEIASLDKFKEEYAILMRTGSTSAQSANAVIMGSAETTDVKLEALWRWYRTVDASHKALAKQVMDQAASNPLASSALALADFKTTFDTLLGVPDETNAPAKWLIVNAILGDSLPSVVANQPTWRKYQALDAANQAVAKTELIEGKFVKSFETLWTADVKSQNLAYANLMTVRANTMNVKHPGKAFTDEEAAHGDIAAPLGLNTNKVYSAVSDSVREQMVRIMG